VVGFDADGNEVAHRCLPPTPDEVDASDPTVIAMCTQPR
jgi:hypothetical protein